MWYKYMICTLYTMQKGAENWKEKKKNFVPKQSQGEISETQN